MIKAGIVGGTGYTGVELLRILLLHPQVTVSVVTSRTDAGQRLDSLYPNLAGVCDLLFSPPEPALLAACDVVFFATPNGTAMTMAADLLAKGVKVIDLSADFRIKDVAEWRRWYGMTHASPELVNEAVYGLPEINRQQIRQANLIACPGCYPTAVQLGLLPVLEQGVVDAQYLIADVKSGVSGAGRKAELPYLMTECGESFKAYAVAGHRHLPEIVQGLQKASAEKVGLTFVPHLTPMIRGIHATLYARVKSDADLQALYEQRYQSESFVQVLPAGSHADTRNVKGGNRCQIAVHQPQNGDVAVILSVIDNLVKGASGQAVQCMNLMYGLPETAGLQMLALYP